MMPRISSFSLKEKPGVSRVPKLGRHSISTIVSMRPLPAGRFGSAVVDAVLLPSFQGNFDAGLSWLVRFAFKLWFSACSG